jgi:UDP:flavonoid glycosyltransferase YjiC (YdhE family)
MEPEMRHRMTNESKLPPQSGSPRILFIGEAIAISHVVRPYVLAAHLHRSGFDVCLACDPRYNHLAAQTEVPTTDLTSLPPETVESRLARHEPIHDLDTLDRYVNDEVRILRSFKPDVVVGDMRPSLAVSSRLTQTTYINLAEAHWSPAVETHYELPSSPLAALVGMPLSNLLFQAFQPVALGYHTLPLNMIRIKYGLPPIGPDIKACNTYGDYTVYPNEAGLFPLSRPLPARHSFLGPISWSPGVERPEWWNRLPSDRPVLYVSLGSTGQPSLLDSILNVLEGLPVTVMVATAGRCKMRHVPKNFFVADFLPGSEAAERSRLVICNGGTMSGQQALLAGTPYLGLISNMDQMLFSMAVRRASACELLREGDVNEGTLRPVISRMLAEEKYQAAAKSIAARMTAMDSCKKFEELVCAAFEGNAVRRAQAV